MKIFIFALLMLFGLHAQAARISIVKDHGCAILNDGVHCWGNFDVNPESVGLQLSAPDQIAVMTDGACVMDQGKVQCWNQIAYRTFEVENQKIQEIRSTGNYLLVRTDRGFGVYDPFGWTTMPARTALQNQTPGVVTEAAAFEKNLCWIQNGRVDCQLDYRKADLPLPRPLVNPRKIWLQETMVCVLDDRGYLCWTLNDGYPQSPIPGNLKGYESLSFGDNNLVCGVRKGQLTCWNSSYGFPASNSVREVSVSGKSGCLLDDSGVKCWGDQGLYEGWSEGLQDTVDLESSSRSLCARSSSGVVSCVYNGTFGSMMVRTIDRYTDSYSLYTSAENVECFVGKAQGFYCTGATGLNEVASNFPRPYHPTSVAIASSLSYEPQYICAVQDGVVTCESYTTTFLPKDLKDVTEIAGGQLEFCAIMKIGIRCWSPIGGKDEMQMPTDLLKTKTAHSLIMESHRACAIVDGKIRCWGPDKISEALIPAVKNPSALMFLSGGMCATDDKGVKCSDDIMLGDLEARLGKVLKVVSSNDGICGMGQKDGGPVKVACTYPGFTNINSIIQGSLLALRNSPERDWDHLGGSLFNLNQLPQRLHDRAMSLPPLEAWVLGGLSDFLSKNEACQHSLVMVNTRPECVSRFSDIHGDSILESRWLALNLIAPIIRGETSELATKTLIPELNSDISGGSAFLAQHGIDFNQGPRAQLGIRTAVKVAELVVRASMNLVSIDESRQLTSLLRAIAQASAAPTSPQAIANLKSQYQQNQAILSHAGSDYRTAFLPQVMKAAVAALP